MGMSDSFTRSRIYRLWTSWAPRAPTGAPTGAPAQPNDVPLVALELIAFDLIGARDAFDLIAFDLIGAAQTFNTLLLAKLP